MVRSPCTNICAINYNLGFYMGCKGTIKEMANWYNLNDVERKKILLKIPDRKFFYKQEPQKKIKY